MNWMKRKVVWFLLFMFAIIFGLFALSRPSPSKVVLASARLGEMISEISDSGFTRFKNVSTVLAPQNGWFESAVRNTGEHVEKGVTLLATIVGTQSPLLDNRTRASLQAHVESARAQERQAHANLNRLKLLLNSSHVQLARLEKVLIDGGVSLQEVEVARTRSKEIRTEIISAQATIDSLKHMREASEIAVRSASGAQKAESLSLRSSHSGVLAWIYDEKPRYVTIGTPLFDVAEVGALYFEIDILAGESLAIKPGQKVRFSEFDVLGQVRSVAPTALPRISPLGISEQRVRIWVDFTSKIPKEWPSGLELEAHIQIEKRDKTLLVPLTAVWREDSNEYVYKVEKKSLRKTKITTGLQSLSDTEVIAGIAENDLVVRFPNEDLRDGERVSWDEKVGVE